MELRDRPLGHNRDFLVLTTVQWLSQYGEFTFFVSAVWAITMRTSSPLFVSAVFLANLLPGLIISPFAGMVVDRVDRRTTILLSSIARSVLLLILWFAWSVIGDGISGLWLVLAVTLVMSILARVFSAVHFALIPVVVPEKDLQRANSVSSFIMNAAYAAGSFLSALFIAKLGWAFVIILTAGLFAGGAVLSCILPVTFTASSMVHRSILGDTMKSLLSAVDIVRAIPRIQVCMILAAVASVVSGTVSLLPVYIKKALGETIIQYGLVEGLSVVGAVLSSLILARVAVIHPYRAMRVSVAAIACAVLWFGSGLHIVTLVLARMIIAFALGVFNILFVTEFHRLLPGDYRGRVFSLSYIVSTVPYILSTAGAGMAAEFVPFWAVWVVAGCIGLVGLVFCPWLLSKVHGQSKKQSQSQVSGVEERQ